MKLESNIHTHTSRCGHAYGQDFQYVDTAIDNGISFLGFSDHICFPHMSQKGIRQEYSMLDDYITSINNLKGTYKDKIEIHLGYEAEFYPESLEYYKYLKEEKGIEYFILGQHCYIKDNEFKFFVADIKDKAGMNLYFDYLIQGIKSGLFKYVAHPDLIINGYQAWDEDIIKRSREAIEACIEMDIPLEINLGGARWILLANMEDILGYHLDVEYLYPYSKFWELVGTYKDAKVVIGVDAHKPDHFTKSGIELAEKYINQYHLNVIDVKSLFKNKK